jgi:hypothetical protein
MIHIDASFNVNNTGRDYSRIGIANARPGTDDIDSMGSHP